MIEGVNDSKKVSEKKRERVFEEIIKNAISYGIRYYRRGYYRRNKYTSGNKIRTYNLNKRA